MDERDDPELAICQLIEVLHMVLVPHEHRVPRARFCLFALEALHLRDALTVHSVHPISNLTKNVLLQAVCQVVGIGEVKADLMHLKLLEQVDEVVLVITISIVCSCE